MGLRKAVSMPNAPAGWAVPIAVAALALGAAAGGRALRSALQYERAGIADGELWRLVSAHVVHLGGAHLALNLGGLLLVWLLVGSALTSPQWLLVLAGSMLAIDAGLWWLMPGLDWYVGLSGVLHGLLMAGVIGGWLQRPRESLLLAVLLIAKLGYETVAGAMPATGSAVGGDIITEAHLYGTAGGAAAALLLRLYTFARRTTTTSAEHE
ncbi:MAG: rhombosortase [Woeseiaceae bacterium]|nr:rhombosortase [Woeseiaceae bacterium]